MEPLVQRTNVIAVNHIRIEQNKLIQKQIVLNKAHELIVNNSSKISESPFLECKCLLRCFWIHKIEQTEHMVKLMYTFSHLSEVNAEWEKVYSN